MGDFETFLRVLVAIAAGIVTLGGAASVFERIGEKAAVRRNEIAQQVEKHEQRLANDHKRLNELESSSRLIMRGVMQLTNHEIDGNHTDQLVEVRDDMERYLINKYRGNDGTAHEPEVVGGSSGTRHQDGGRNRAWAHRHQRHRDYRR